MKKKGTITSGKGKKEADRVSQIDFGAIAIGQNDILEGAEGQAKKGLAESWKVRMSPEQHHEMAEKIRMGVYDED